MLNAMTRMVVYLEQKGYLKPSGLWGSCVTVWRPEACRGAVLRQMHTMKQLLRDAKCRHIDPTEQRMLGKREREECCLLLPRVPWAGALGGAQCRDPGPSQVSNCIFLQWLGAGGRGLSPVPQHLMRKAFTLVWPTARRRLHAYVVLPVALEEL